MGTDPYSYIANLKARRMRLADVRHVTGYLQEAGVIEEFEVGGYPVVCQAAMT